MSIRINIARQSVSGKKAGIDEKIVFGVKIAPDAYKGLPRSR